VLTTDVLICRFASAHRCQDARAQASGREAQARSRTPVAAVDLPCPVGPLEDMQGNRTGSHRRAAAIPADLPPARVRDANLATMPGEPKGSINRRGLASAVGHLRQRES
jgi:hypothetical protein